MDMEEKIQAGFSLAILIPFLIAGTKLVAPELASAVYEIDRAMHCPGTPNRSDFGCTPDGRKISITCDKK